MLVVIVKHNVFYLCDVPHQRRLLLLIRFGALPPYATLRERSDLYPHCLGIPGVVEVRLAQVLVSDADLQRVRDAPVET